MTTELQVLVDCYMASMGGVEMSALSSHYCGPGLIPGLGVMCELSLFILSLASSVFLQFSPSTKINVPK
jgi:hypothetical protein